MSPVATLIDTPVVVLDAASTEPGIYVPGNARHTLAHYLEVHVLQQSRGLMSPVTSGASIEAAS